MELEPLRGFLLQDLESGRVRPLYTMTVHILSPIQISEPRMCGGGAHTSRSRCQEPLMGVPPSA